MIDRTYQRFGEEAVLMSGKGWKYLSERSPGDGIFREFKYKRHTIIVVILPSIGFPTAPPVVTFFADDVEVFETINHPCIWTGPIAESIVASIKNKGVRSKILDLIRNYEARVLHIREEEWAKFGRFRNTLMVLNDFLTEKLGFKPFDYKLSYWGGREDLAFC